MATGEVEPWSGGYDEYFDPPLEGKYECPICLKGLREPVQTGCGHRFCKECIFRSIRDAGPKCPLDNKHLSESQNYRTPEDRYAIPMPSLDSGDRDHTQETDQIPQVKCFESSGNKMAENFMNYRIPKDQYATDSSLCNGSYIWKIDNYRQCRQAALSGVMTAVHSPSFYTNVYGYKLCMRINLNGVDSGVGKHVALFVHMMQGDYDSILEWPFTGRIALSLLDQSDGAEYRHHISETLVAKPNLLPFQRPTAPRNYMGYGYVEFAPIETIREPQYVRNNTMLVRIQIFH